MKRCSKCHRNKPLTDFARRSSRASGVRSQCKDCDKLQRQTYRSSQHGQQITREYAQSEAHKEAVMRYRYTSTGKTKTKLANKRYAQSAKGKETRTRAYQKWVKTEHGRKVRRKAQRKYAQTIPGKLRAAISCNLRQALKQDKAGRRWETILGYTLPELKTRLEEQFEAGMSWDNYGRRGWHIDHIIPVKQFTLDTRAAVQRCFALSNLAPRWGTTKIARSHGSSQIGNCNKGAKLLFGVENAT